jgi:Domain of unknown function (DUF4407)
MSATSKGQGGLYTYASFENGSGEKKQSNFLWWCSGAYIDLLKQYPSEHSKYSGMGGVILATFALAALSSGYAVYSVFGNIGWTIGFALIWALIIFNFDRFLVSTMRKYGVSKRRQLNMAIPRFVLAILIGVTIARPLELKIFEKEIDVKVAQNRHQKILLNDSLLNIEAEAAKQNALVERGRLTTRKILIEDSLGKLQTAYVQEADGTGGSGKRGIEKLTRLKMDAYNNAAAQYLPELQKLAVNTRYQDSLLANQQTILEKKRNDYEAALQTKVGFLERNKALSDLTNEESSVFWSVLMVSLLIILIEAGPILSKLIMNTGPYDIALAQTELIQMARSENEMRKDKELLQDKLEKIYAHKKQVSDEVLEKVKALQQQKINTALQQWQKGEWKENNEVPLDDVMQNIKTKYGYEEGSVL